MRIAVISDLHGNSVALDHVLKEIEGSNVDQVVCLGDVATLGPQPLKTTHRLQEAGCPCLLGNHDEFMIDPARVREYSKVPVVVKSVEWCHSLMTPKEIAFFKSFKTEHDMITGSKRLRFFHGSPTSNSEDVIASMSPAKLEQLIGKTEGDVLVFGHTHLQMLVQHHGRHIFNPGSLGSPFKDLFFCEAPTIFSHAEYAIIDVKGQQVDILLRRTQPDMQKLKKSVRDSEYPLKEFLLQQYESAAG
ncbi:MAG: metallophosphoesterase family protein [Bdellovibrionales bacterium]|nr:metallophosphoesterase family protein [Bdellovibrionales bacterium]